ncbi:MAG: hypothetical protein AB1Z98_20825, partial [Nannocystaceae bacterium]
TEVIEPPGGVLGPPGGVPRSAKDPSFRPWWDDPGREDSGQMEHGATRRYLPPAEQAEPDAPRFFRRPRPRRATPLDREWVGRCLLAPGVCRRPEPSTPHLRVVRAGLRAALALVVDKAKLR